MTDKNQTSSKNLNNDSTVQIPNKTIIEHSSYDAVYEAVGTNSTSQPDISLMLGNESDTNNTSQNE